MEHTNRSEQIREYMDEAARQRELEAKKNAQTEATSARAAEIEAERREKEKERLHGKIESLQDIAKRFGKWAVENEIPPSPPKLSSNWKLFAPFWAERFLSDPVASDSWRAITLETYDNSSADPNQNGPRTNYYYIDTDGEIITPNDFFASTRQLVPHEIARLADFEAEVSVMHYIAELCVEHGLEWTEEG
jgi:hypothetical protein